MILRVLFGTLLVSLSSAAVLGQSYLSQVSIPVTNANDQIWDPVHGLLYMTTATGSVQRYNPATQSLLTPWSVSSDLLGADITPDGAYLYSSDGGTAGVVRKINTATGAVTNLTYNLSFYEGIGYDLKIASNGLAFFTTEFNGSGWTPLRQINLATDAISVVTNDPASSPDGEVRQNTGITRSADGNILFYQESNISDGPIFDYNAVSSTYPAHSELGGFVGANPVAINPTDSLIAFVGSQITIFNTSLATVRTLNTTGQGVIGVAFDPTRDVLYALENQGTSDQMVVYSTDTWLPIFTKTLGNLGSLSGIRTDAMTVSSDGTHIFLDTSSGEAMLFLPEPAPMAVGLAGLVAILFFRNTRKRRAI